MAEINTTVKKEKKKFEFPHIFVLLFIMMVIFEILTYIIPAGQYKRVIDPITKRSIIDPGSFQFIKNTPVGPFKLFLCLIDGLIDAAPISFLIFCAFSSLYVVQKTGAIDAGIAWLANSAKKNPKSSKLMIALCIIVFAAWGSTGTISYEEIVAFIPIFCSLSIALGYDPIVGMMMSFVAVGMGFSSATVNPFTIGVAQSIAELPLFSGLGLRLCVLACMILLTIVYTLKYAKKIKDNPAASYVHDVDLSDFKINSDDESTKFTLQKKLVLVDLLLLIICMVYGLLKLKWYINQLSAAFIIMAIVAGIISKWSPNKFADIMVEGLSKAVMTALVVGAARGILMVVSSGNILDTIIYAAANILGKAGSIVSSYGMLVFQTLLNFLIPSGSGQAATSMPIMAPLADAIGLKRQIAVLAFQFGDGFSDLVWPTSFLLIACGLSKVPVNKYYKVMIPFFCLSLLIQIVFITIAVMIGYGPM